MNRKNYFLPALKQLEIDVDYGSGSYLFDKTGNKYLDFFSGMGVNALGHQNPKIKQAILEQNEKNLHLFGYFLQDQHYNIAEQLIENTHFSRIFFSNSGTESIEGALKLIRKWGNANNRKDIVCFNGGFHGRTLGALSITAQKSKQDAFQPLLPGIKAIDKTIEAIQNYLNESTVAVVLELITGEGGIVETDQSFIDELHKLKEKYGFLILVDEIQSGIGRTGKLFSYMHYGMTPDIVTTAKAIGGGLPLGAFLLVEDLANVFSPGEHGTTFGGNPMACATGLVVLKELLENHLLEHVNDMHNYIKEKATELKESFPEQVKEFRGKGLMIGLLVGSIANDLMKQCLKNGLIINATQNSVIRLLPALNVRKEEIDECFFILNKSLSELT
jgi:acetylornithine/N-succinyldiaminopimelate aminotransferase